MMMMLVMFKILKEMISGSIPDWGLIKNCHKALCDLIKLYKDPTRPYKALIRAL